VHHVIKVQLGVMMHYELFDFISSGYISEVIFQFLLASIIKS